MSKAVPFPVVIAVRFFLAVTPRDQAARSAVKWMERYLDLGSQLDADQGRRPVTVPPMKGVDPEMRSWSYFQLLEHNAIVNRSISELVGGLALGKDPGPAAQIDPKTGVLPGPDCGPEARDHFRSSVLDHLEQLKDLPSLRGTATRPHPLFGPFNAHRWNGMFSLHLKIHWKQAGTIIGLLLEGTPKGKNG